MLRSCPLVISSVSFTVHDDVLDGRKGDGWFKWKPEYTDRLADDLDLLIVGGYYGYDYDSCLCSLR